MIRDNVCDEATNIEECLFDGGDCCLPKGKKDTTLCRDCTCMKTIDRDNLETSFKTLRVRIIQNDDDIQELVRRAAMVVEDVLDVEVCSTLCLEKSIDLLVNGWSFDAQTSSCSCLWLKSTECIENRAEIPTQSTYSVTTKSFVQMTKLIECSGLLQHFVKILHCLLTLFS